jgi:hypothetical protein
VERRKVYGEKEHEQSKLTMALFLPNVLPWTAHRGDDDEQIDEMSVEINKQEIEAIYFPTSSAQKACSS